MTCVLVYCTLLLEAVVTTMTPQFVLRASLSRAVAYKRKTQDQNTADQQLRAGESEIDNLGWSNGYAEPGYTDPPKGVLTANWNYFTSGVDSLLERMGFACEWSDEWATCDSCGKLVRISPDCYSWESSYRVMNDCEVICNACMDWGEYLESIEDDARACVSSNINPADYGYARVPREYETGFHPGQTDNPSKVLAQLQAEGHSHIVFRISEQSQFYTAWEAWEKTA